MEPSSSTRPLCRRSRGASATGVTVNRLVARVEPTTLPSARTWEAISCRVLLPLHWLVLANTNLWPCCCSSFQVNSQSPR